MTRAAAAVVEGVTKRAKLAVVAVFFVHGVLFASWTAHIPHIKSQLGLTDGTLGFALLGTPLGSVSAIVLAGFLIPRVGSRLMVRICLVGYCLSGPIVGLTGSLLGLLLALFLWGAFQGMLDIAMNTQAIGVEARRGRPLMNGMHAWWSIGAFAGAGAGTLGVALGVSLSEQLLALGIPLMVVVGLLTARMLPDSVSKAERADAARSRNLSAEMLILGAVAFGSMLCEGAAADWSSVYLHDSLGAGAALAGLGYTSFAFAMVLVRLFGDRLLVRYRPQRLLPALAGTAAAVFAAALLAATPVAAVIGLLALGLGLGAVVPAAFSAAGRLPGVHPGVGVAGVSGLGWAGFVCGPPLIGQLSAATSLPIALAVIPLLAAFIAVACARVVALRGSVVALA